MITEIVILQIKAVVDISDQSSQSGKMIRESLVSELAANGARNAYYGQLIERPEMVVIFVNWDSVDDHKRFMKSPNYEAHVKHLQTIVNDDHPVTVLHVPFMPTDNPAPALGANSSVGATEIVFFYFPSTLDATAKEAIMSSVDKMRPVVDRSESLAVFDGWALEGDVLNPASPIGEDAKSQVYVNVVGWVDVDAHMRFQGSEDFKQNIHHLLGIKDMKHTEFYHAKLLAA